MRDTHLPDTEEMDKFDRIMALYRELTSRRYPVSRKELEQRLECKGITVKRAVRALRDYFHVPVIYDREHNGYMIDSSAGEHEVPGLWFSAEEIHALLAADSLLSNLEPGLVKQETAPFRRRLRAMMQKLGGAGSQLDRIRLLNMGRRRDQSRHFPRIAQSVLQRTRLRIRYHSRSGDEISEREISPQRLAHYRDNWYLDAWCHDKNALRTFSLDRIDAAAELKKKARNLSDEELDDHLAGAFGIFAGKPDKIAKLVFNQRRARWVSNETWHPDQKGQWREDGSYELHLPYHHAPELIGDILKYGAEVEVLEPPELREAVVAELAKAAKNYT